MTDFETALANTVQAARQRLGLSVSALSERSGVSRAMIAKIESGDVQPTAALLGRLSGALGLTLSELVARAEGTPGRVARHADQPMWTDPATGYTRRAVSPRTNGPVQLVEVSLPPGATVSYPADACMFTEHQLWVLDGTLLFEEGDTTHELSTGDCLELGPPAVCTFANRSSTMCRYLVVVSRR